MTTKKRISGAVTVRINVGNFQHIELVKQAEQEIEFSSREEMIKKEDELRDDLLASLKRDMSAIPAALNKGIEEAIKVEEAIKKAIPEWMGKEGVPNLANDATKKLEVKVSAEQKAAKDAAGEVISNVTASAKEVVKLKKLPEAPFDSSVVKDTVEFPAVSSNDFFDDDFGLDQKASTPETPAVANVTAEVEPTKKVVTSEAIAATKPTAKPAKAEKNDLFDDDDLFN